MMRRGPPTTPFRRVGYAVRAMNVITLRVTDVPGIDGLYRVDGARAIQDRREVPVVSAERGRVGTAMFDPARRCYTFGISDGTIPFVFPLSMPGGAFERMMHAGLERAPLSLRQEDLSEYRAALRNEERRREVRGRQDDARVRLEAP